jgi:nucleoside-diphosphate-sugar epimerase
MGPTVALMAQKACKKAGINKQIIGVARFSNPELRKKLEHSGIQTIYCDLLNRRELENLPKAENIIFMAGRKFGAIGSEPLTWMMNTIVPANVIEYFKGKRIVAFSTGCVYSLESPASGGSKESDIPAPVGEYANSCLGRERIFEYAAAHYDSKVLLYRLNYSIDLRYGVLVDIAQKVYDQKPVDLGVSYVNVIWQGDACNRALLSLKYASSPAKALNITGPELLSVREIAEQFGKLFGKPVDFTGQDMEQYYLSNASESIKLFGLPTVKPEQMIQWVAEWMKNGGTILDKPTHFEVTNGQFLDK